MEANESCRVLRKQFPDWRPLFALRTHWTSWYEELGVPQWVPVWAFRIYWYFKEKRNG